MNEKEVEYLLADATALRFAVLALIHTHPNPRALRDKFQTLVASLQVGGAQVGIPPMSQATRDSIERLSKEMASRVQ